MKIVVLYTMKGCPYCDMIKEELKKEEIDYINRDINEFSEEYDEFSEKTENEYVPAVMLLTLDEKDNAENVELMAPERDFQDIHEAVEKIKDYLLI
jgi:glutaredoxin